MKVRNKAISIGFTRSGTHPLNLLAYQKILSKEGIRVFAVCEGEIEKKEYGSDLQVYCFEQWLKSHWGELKCKNLETYQKKYPDINLWEIFYTDRYIRYKYNYNDAVKFIIGMIRFWEEILETEKASYLISDCIIGAENFLGMIVGKKMGIPYISIVCGRNEKNKSFFSCNEGFRNMEFNRLMESGYVATDEENRLAEQFINSYKDSKKQPFYMKNTVMQSRRLCSTFWAYIKKVKHVYYLFDGRFYNKFNPQLYHSRRERMEPALEPIRRMYIKKYFQNPDYREDYILYPLHFQPEASTCVYARKYENQLFFIEQLAKSIPVGKILYVKEHSVRVGHRPISFYKQILKYPNVKLIAPGADIHTLIQNSAFLIVLTSTAGFEALMYEKPVFVCGDVFYEGFSGVKKIRDVFDEKESFLIPPKQDRKRYMNQMACYLKTLKVCTTREEPLYECSKKELRSLQKLSMKCLLDYLSISNG